MFYVVWQYDRIECSDNAGEIRAFFGVLTTTVIISFGIVKF